MKASEIPLVVVSHDQMYDLWRQFFWLLGKYWPDCEHPIILINGQIAIDDGPIKVLHSGEKNWAEGLTEALKIINAPYFIYIQDDHFLTKKIDNCAFEEDISYCVDNGFDVLPLRATLPGSESEFEFLDKQVTGRLWTDTRKGLCMAFQPTLFKTKSLLHGINTQESIWDNLRNGPARTEELGIRQLRYQNQTYIPFHFVRKSAIRRKLWLPDGLNVLKENNLDRGLWFRGVNFKSFGTGIRRWATDLQRYFFVALMNRHLKKYRSKIKVPINEALLRGQASENLGEPACYTLP